MPPIASIGQVLNHVKVCSAVGTLVVPYWPSAPFWPLLFSEHSDFRFLISGSVKIDNPEGVFVQGRNKNSIFGTMKFQSPVLCLRLNGVVSGKLPAAWLEERCIATSCSIEILLCCRA